VVGRAVIAVVAVGLVAVAETGSAAKPDAPPTRKCNERVEVGRPVQFRDADDFVVGRVSFSSLTRYADPDAFATTYSPQGGYYGIKSAVAVRANRNVKLSIAPAQRAQAGLSYTMDHRLAAPGKQPVVLFAPCRSSQRAFSYRGKVGGATAFSGGLAVSGPMCLVLESRTRGRTPVRRAVSLGMGDSCAQP
jgi:hypothetical protein